MRLLLFLLLFAQLNISYADSRPNILLIIADDMGYSDIGVFGGRISTPNIDMLAGQGIAFTRFHTAPVCSETRAMLYSGNNNHVAGVGRQHAGPIMKQNMPGYENQLSARVVPFPSIMKDAGYHTYITGKWHLGNEEENSPLTAGFERSFVLTSGSGNHFNEVGLSKGGSVYREDGKLVSYPVGQFSTKVYTDRLIEFIDNNISDKSPFLGVAAYTAPHWPLQVPEEDLNLYRDKFDDGYDRLREDNFTAAKKLDFVPQGARIPPRNANVPYWVDLTTEQRRIEARKMELYAAMVDNLDRHIGRLLDYLKSVDIYENTLIVFISDNGAAATDFYERGPYSEFLRVRYDNSFDNMGRVGSFVSYGVPWGEAGSAPFRGLKGQTLEGGITTPMIIQGPGLSRKGISGDYVTVMDLAPTLIELAGTKYPQQDGISPMLGESLLPYLRGITQAVHDDQYATVMFRTNFALVRQGDWKLVSTTRPFDESKFELFNVREDPGETENLIEQHPDQYQVLINLWRERRKALGIVLPEDL
jgi:arylsulfatase